MIEYFRIQARNVEEGRKGNNLRLKKGESKK